MDERLKLELYSEPVPATGAMTAQGAKNALGRPSMDRWELFTRETIQNSWDARLPGGKLPVDFSIHLRHISARRRAVVHRLFGQIPNDANEKQWGSLAEAKQLAIIVSDRGTTGLTGPTRADQAIGDFTDFVWNVGQPPDKRRGGGTYGYGKSVLYRASRALTIGIYSRCSVGRRVESRFICAALGQPFESEGRRFTGRHWWGRGQNPIQPVTGREADKIAASLGIPVMTGAETGTSIMIFAADVDEPAQVMQTIADATLWHCWPKLVTVLERERMRFDYRIDDNPINVEAPEDHPRLRHFVSAYRALDSGQKGCEKFEICSQRPAKRLGGLALARFPRVTPTDEDGNESGIGDIDPISGPCRHVALLRAPRLVVKYLPCKESTSPYFEWAGVFIADDQTDRSFAASEPPAHDDWVAKAVNDKKKARDVNVALREIKREADQFNVPAQVFATGERAPLGRLADRLGRFLSATPGSGIGVSPSSSSSRKKSSAKSATPRVVRQAQRLLLLDSEPAIEVHFSVAGPEGTPVRVSASASAAVADGVGEYDPPERAPVPSFVCFGSPDGTRSEEPSVVIPPDRRDSWTVTFKMPSQTAVIVKLACSEVRS